LSNPVGTTASGIVDLKLLGVVVMNRKQRTTTTTTKSWDLFRHEELTQVTAEAVAELPDQL
jgi:hypothetical protein